MSTIEEILEKLEQLELLDGSANVEAPTLSISVDSAYDFNYEDIKGFNSGRWGEEAHNLTEINNLLERGNEFVGIVYTYRSVSSALTQVKPSNSEHKEEIYSTMLEVLEPEINKLKNFMIFQEEARTKFLEYLEVISKNQVKPSETFITLMVEIIDMLALLDDLKNMKASLNNDFSFYKRASGMAKKVDAQTDQESASLQHKLGMFLAKQNSISKDLKDSFNTKLPACPGILDALIMVSNSCVERIEDEMYVTPTEKFRLIRVLPYLLYLLHGEETVGEEESKSETKEEKIRREFERRSVFKMKHIKIDKYTKIFRKYPIIPLYGDMQVSIVGILKKLIVNFNEETWGIGKISDVKLGFDYEIINHLSDMRKDFNFFLSRFNNLVKEVKLQLASSTNVGKLSQSLGKEARKLILEGFSLLSDWTGKVLSQAAWKYAHPNNDEEVEAENAYERVIRYNYTSEEKFALVEVITMLKSLASIMLKEDSLLAPIIKTHIHEEVQDFFQGPIFRDMIRINSKKMNKKNAREDLLILRDIASDWKDGKAPEDPALKGEKFTSDKLVVPIRSSPPSPTQLEIIRSMIHAFITQRGKKELFSEKDFTESHVKALREFYNLSFFYPYLIGYSNTIQSITDLGDLWYREFYLELTKCIQFEIESSLAWLLCDHLLDSSNTAMIECVLFPLDIYNDAAKRALTSLNQKFLFDEIEAEVNLAFDQLLYKLSDRSYNYYKMKASSIVIDKEFRYLVENALPDKISRFHVPKSRLSVILRQHHFQLLGRSIDVNALVSQRMNNLVRKNINYAIARFEASPITSIIDLENLLKVIKLTHSLMVEEGLVLDSWDTILSEIDQNVSITSLHGRVVLHTLFEIVSDLGANFVYNSMTNRFVKVKDDPIRTEDDEGKVPRGSTPKPSVQFLYGNKYLTLAFATVAELTSEYFGVEHVLSIIRLIGKRSLPLLIDQLLENMELKLHHVLNPYFAELVNGMPRDRMNLPQYSYGTMGGFQFFTAKLVDIRNYPELLTGVFQHFREWGNCIAFLHLVDIGLGQYDATSFVLSSPFFGVTDKRSSKSDQTPLVKTTTYVQAFLEKRKDITQCSTILPTLGTSVLNADTMYQVPSERHSLLKLALSGIKDMLSEYEPMWGVDPSKSDNSIIPIDTTTEFYRIWSAIQYLFLIDIDDNIQLAKTSMELFGDGIHYAGCTIIHFLNQRHRFEALDFSYHLLNMNEAIPWEDQTMTKFVSRLHKVKDINDQVFRMLEVNQPNEEEDIEEFEPPTSESTGKKFIHQT